MLWEEQVIGKAIHVLKVVYQSSHLNVDSHLNNVPLNFSEATCSKVKDNIASLVL